MTMLAKTYTEPIDRCLADACAELDQHPLLTAARDGELPRAILEELAYHQYSDSILWIPMLAQMKEKATRSPRVLDGMKDAWEETREVPDDLWRRACSAASR